MFTKSSEEGYKTPIEGISMKTLVWGEKTLMTEFILKKGAKLPIHDHPYEQTGYLVSGQMVLYIDEEPNEITPGDSWCIPENVPHRAEINEDSVAIEVFSPVRTDYLPE